jgi:hypothetical protein
VQFFVYEVTTDVERSRVVTTEPSEAFGAGPSGAALRLVGVFPQRDIAEAVRDEEEEALDTGER